MNIGVFSGSFNPIHIGHLALANWICEYTEIEEVWFMVSPQNPFKEEAGLMDERLRLKMVEESIAGYAKFRASDFEFSLPKPSYTIKTMRALKEKYQGCRFSLIVGADNWNAMPLWKNGDELISEFPIIVYPRRGFEIDIPRDHPNAKKVEAPLFEVSSTFIRESLKAGKDVRFFLPEAIRRTFNR